MYNKPGFLDVVAPLIEEAHSRLRAGLAELPAAARLFLPPVETLGPLLFDGVRDHLERIITPTLALELNVARLRGELRGRTPEARHAHFLERLSGAELRAALADEYPLMFRLAADRLDTWVRVSLELLGHLSADLDSLADTFFDGRLPGQLKDVRFPQRSTKGGGRAVVLLTFTSGARLVHKPRSLAVELRFQELLAWLNRMGFEPGFRPVTMLDRGTYGWMGWIDPATCGTTDEISRFYRRQGAFLALFYALEATDLHMSNVIAAGEHPALIDLETLFHPRDGELDWPALDLAVDNAIYYSVLRPGLLPEPETAGVETADRLDQSGLVGAGGQLTPYEVPTWRGRGTDAMRLDRARKIISGSKNLPTLRGQAVDPIDYLDALDEGFTAAYRLMMLHPDELLAGSGPLARFAGVQVRVLPRSGRDYGDILDQSFHPDLLRHAEARHRFLSTHLRRGAGEDAYPSQLVEYELADLTVGDTPLFTTHVGSRDIVSGRDGVVHDYFPFSGLEMSRRRIADLDETDLDRQRWFIRAAFATVADDDGSGASRRREWPDRPAAGMRRRAIAAATAIGERLAATAVRAGREVSWVGLEPDEFDNWTVEPLGDGLAHGLAGVALFLDQLSVQTNNPRFRELAGAAVATILRMAAEDAGEPIDDDEPIGLFDGVGGRLWALSRLAAAGDYPGLDREIARLVGVLRHLLDNPVEDEDIGLAFGLAGSLAGLLAAGEVFPESGALETARLAGDLLLARLGTSAPEVTAVTPLGSYYLDLPGTAGPMAALAELTGDYRYGEAAEALLAEILAAGNAGAGAWRAYLSARPWLSSNLREWADDRLREAMASLTAGEHGGNHSLVYGDMGILDLLLSAADALSDTALYDLAGRFATAVMADIDRGGLRAAVPLQVESPGWATGLAGIGYGWLRFAAPEMVPAFPSLLDRQEAR